MPPQPRAMRMVDVMKLKWRMDYWPTLHVIGVLCGSVCFAASLLPSLVPREPMIQGLLSGLCFSVGYGFGYALLRLWLAFGLPMASGQRLTVARSVMLNVCALLAILALWMASDWQNRQRALMAMAPVDGMRPWLIALISASVFALVMLAVRLFKAIRLAVSKRLQRYLPAGTAWVLGLCLTAGLFYLLGNRILAGGALRAMDASYSAMDALFEEDSPRPATALKSGSAESLLHWDEIGRTGRAWIAGAPDRRQIEQMTGKPALEPIRVYVGRQSAEDETARAKLALDEMIRVGAFKRKTLVITTPTGTGWIDPNSQSALEYVLLGDVATVAVQYSYLASWLALLAEPEYGERTARALFAAVYRHWQRLPAATRPKLYLHGLSLGALNSAHSHNFYQVINDPFQGVFWVGMPFANSEWRQVTADRNADSPAWLPRYGDGSVIRFTGQDNQLQQGHAPWGRFRMVYLQYASDAVTFFDASTLWRKPSWLNGERGPDVSPDMRWLPGITFLQLSVDLMQATQTPLGYGHVYAFEHYLAGWAALTDAPGWTPAELEALKARVARTE
jgi:uncharacterized membrane protein